MRLEELAFVNQQLAGMLQSGIPLEGALRQLSQGMRRGRLRAELQRLEADLAQGTPLADALARRELPPLYVEMLKVGQQSNNLPAVLMLLADHYNRVYFTWTRLKGLMVYPAIVLLASLALSLMVAVLYSRLMTETGIMSHEMTHEMTPGTSLPSLQRLLWTLWLPVGLLGVFALGLAAVLTVPSWRRACSWRVPAFKEARVSQLASALALMLQNGCTLGQSLTLVRQLEAGTPLAAELKTWQERLSAGHKRIADLAAGGKVIPPLFVWLVAGSGEDWISGFKQAAEIYRARTLHRIDVLLYAALPVTVLGLGVLIVGQVVPMARIFLNFIRLLSGPFEW